MNAIILKNAVKKYSKQAQGLGEAEVKAMLATDKSNYSSEDIDEIYKAIQVDQKPTDEKKRPNDGIDLKFLDYFGLIPVEKESDDEKIMVSNDAFKKYRDIEKTLVDNQNYDFVQFKANGILKRNAEGNLFVNAQGQHVLIGLKINKPEPENYTRIPWKVAKELNSQIMNPNNPITNSRYYFLRKY